jgi:LPXTG-site transpeptidase (sortase) family protein
MTKRKRKTKAKPTRLAAFLIIGGALLLGLWATHRVLYARAISLSDAILAAYQKQPVTSSLPIHITIGDMIRLPVVESGKVNGTWAISQTSANHVASSALPGQKGNIIIYGHNAPKLFGQLKEIHVGNFVEIRMTDSTLHRYIVTETQWVTPGHTELLTPTTEETLTLYTCGGLLDALRVVVQAKPLKE